MANPLLSVRLPQELFDLLMAHCEQTGLDKSKATIEALTQYLKPPSPTDELAQLKARVEKLERYSTATPPSPVIR